MNFNEELNDLSSKVNHYLEEYFSGYDRLLESRLYEAMRYSVLAGGKRIRPVLFLSVAKVLCGKVDEVMPFAAAMEMIHSYSLIHDDLPAMDDDDFRRGKPTNHKVYGEATAILAGDGLLNEAFELIMRNAVKARNVKQALEAAVVIAEAAGKAGMIAGQVIDMESEGVTISCETLNEMHRKKTGALLKASVLAPAVLLGASSDMKSALLKYAEGIGIAFQIKDDILDVESTTDVLGKPVGSDEKNQKTTYVTLFGLETAKKMLYEATNKAIDAIKPYGDKFWFLKEVAHFIAERSH